MTRDIAERSVRADLHLAVGELEATVDADGQRIVVTSEDVAGLLVEATRSWPQLFSSAASLRQTTGRLARLLDEAGLTAEVDSDRGTVLALGRGCDSATLRALLGIGHVRLGRPRALLPLAGGVARASSLISRRTSGTAGGVILAVLLVGAAARRRARSRPCEP